MRVTIHLCVVAPPFQPNLINHVAFQHMQESHEDLANTKLDDPFPMQQSTAPIQSLCSIDIVHARSLQAQNLATGTTASHTRRSVRRLCPSWRLFAWYSTQMPMVGVSEYRNGRGIIPLSRAGGWAHGRDGRLGLREMLKLHTCLVMILGPEGSDNVGNGLQDSFTERLPSSTNVPQSHATTVTNPSSSLIRDIHLQQPRVQPENNTLTATHTQALGCRPPSWPYAPTFHPPSKYQNASAPDTSIPHPRYQTA
jgi:hypothetical protein